ncbi:MAG: ATP-binding protein [Chloroflexota bacterium]|nr:ATP-binding protein [Chloroflexota bacterium]
MLTRLMVKNFKSIGEPGIDIELRPLTIFVGPNGGGKSSILEALAFLAQNVGQNPDKLIVAGELVSYPLLASVAHRLEQDRHITAGLFSDVSEVGYRLSLRPDTRESREQLLNVKGDTLLTHRMSHGFGPSIIESLEYDGKSISADQDSTLHKTLAAIPSYPPLLSSLPYTEDLWPAYDGALPLKQASITVDKVESELGRNVFLVSSLRGEVKPQEGAGEDASWVGRECQHLLVILSRIASPAYEDKNARIQKWSSEFGLSKVWAGVTASNAVSGQYYELDLNTVLNLSSASQGSRQALGMIVQLFWAKPGSIVMIEEPELSLHPEAQDKLPRLFADAVKDGKQVMITTHSHYLLLALTEAVKAGLKAEDIAVYEVKKEPETGTTAKRLPISKEGYIRDWVSSFAEVDQKLLQRRTRRVLAKGSK